MTRRESLAALLTGAPMAWPKPRTGANPRERYQNEVLYRGPFAIPQRIRAACAESPDIRSRTGSSNPRKLIMCYDERNRPTEPALIKWRFRSAIIPDHGKMIGELHRGTDGIYRIVSYRAADPAGQYRDADKLLEFKLLPLEVRRAMGDAAHGPSKILDEQSRPKRIGGPIMPPLVSSAPAWSDETGLEDITEEYSQYVDPSYAERSMTLGEDLL